MTEFLEPSMIEGKWGAIKFAPDRLEVEWSQRPQVYHLHTHAMLLHLLSSFQRILHAFGEGHHSDVGAFNLDFRLANWDNVTASAKLV